MPRRAHDVVRLHKKIKVEEVPSSLDVSFCDDEALPPGLIFTDIFKQKWRLGKPIGRGSFGRIYLVSDDTEKEVTKLTAQYVVKIEPHTNGPMFVEIHCFIRNAKITEVRAWRQQNKQKRLGMPMYVSSGSFIDENTGVKYRFLILPRYYIDLQKIISRTRVLDLKNVLIIAIQILDVLEYLHSKGYTHCDIKSSNLMVGFDGNKYNKALTKPAPSFQKDTKQIILLSKKHKKVKSGKSRTSNYYVDEDYKTNNSTSTDVQGDNDKKLASVKKKLRKILSDKDSRTLHRHHAFNLRQLSNYVNYEDLNSSVCSDRSYQKLLDDVGQMCSPIKVHNEDSKDHSRVDKNLHEIHKEAILSQSGGQIYLLDYGLASKFLYPDGSHKPCVMDLRKAHDGTLEYSSRDSHIGAHSRRSDLETLGYNILDWLTGILPWKTAEMLAEPDLVHVLKKNFLNDVKSLLTACFKTEFYPQFIEKYLQYVKSLDFNEKPDYDYCRSLFKGELLNNGYVHDKELTVNFSETTVSPMKRKLYYSKKIGEKNTSHDFIARNGIKKVYERENVSSFENNFKLDLLKQTLNTSSDSIRKPCTSRNFFISDADLVARLKKSLMPYDVFGKKLSPKNLRSNKKKITKRKGVKRHRNSIGKFGKFMGSARQFTWAEILAGNPEDIIRKERNAVTDNEADGDSNCKYRIRKLSSESSEISDIQSPLLQKDYFLNVNPTPAMKDIIANLKNRINRKPPKETDENCPKIAGYNPAMMKVLLIKEKREAREKLQALNKENSEKQTVAVRYTRSMASKHKSESTKQKDEIEDINKEVVANDDHKTPKKSTRGKNRQKKEVTIAATPTKSTKKMRRTAVTPINRRRLRSSKRKKG